MRGLDGADVGVEAGPRGAPIERRHDVDGPLVGGAVGTRQGRMEQRGEILGAVGRARRIADFA